MNVYYFALFADDNTNIWLCPHQVLFMHIASVEKLPLTTSGSPLHIRCKTFLSVTFTIPRERDCHEIYTILQQLSQPGTIPTFSDRLPSKKDPFYSNPFYSVNTFTNLTHRHTRFRHAVVITGLISFTDNCLVNRLIVVQRP